MMSWQSKGSKLLLWIHTLWPTSTFAILQVNDPMPQDGKEMNSGNAMVKSIINIVRFFRPLSLPHQPQPSPRP